MAIRFFKKFSPDTKVVLGNRVGIQFTTINNQVGYYATEDPYVQSEFERLMRAQQFGLTEITETEFHDEYVEPKKKLAGQPAFRRTWREEWSPSTGVRLAPPANPVAISAPCDNQPKAVVPCGTSMAEGSTPVTPGAVTVNTAPATPPKEFTPKLGKRSLRAKKE